MTTFKKKSKNTKKNSPSTDSYQLTNRAKLKRQLQQKECRLQKYPDNIYRKMDFNILFQFIMNMTFTVFRYGVPMMDKNLTTAIKNMISKRMKMDAAADFKGFQFRHTATFFPSGTK